jgi:acylphosphatase
MAGKHILVQGKVQGVGYRYFVKIQADMLSLKGWVRNLANGEVEVQAFGTEAQLNSFLSQLKMGPPMAKVEKLDVREVEVSDNTLQNEFEIVRGRI